MLSTIVFLLVLLVVVVLPLVSASVKIVQEYERGVIFRLGRLGGVRGPGLLFILPFFDRMVKIDLRTVTLEVPPQEVITRDNVSVKVSAVAYFRVLNPQSAVVEVADFQKATFQIAQTTLRSILGQFDLDAVLANREEINRRLQQIIDDQTEPWGIKVTAVEIKDIELPPNMQSAIARQAEAEREKRAKIINAQGELQAAETLAEAARVITSQTGALQLRYLQTLADIGVDKNSTIVITDIGGLVTELRDKLPILSQLGPKLLEAQSPEARIEVERSEMVRRNS